ncbi:hypothetical protein [Tautonia plasticadhaerens]|uniref:Uncharacterized protein n=1 Tax=Tautonia plasticadhaerens TaxID=2527974 RepID=A0A518GZK5_9BACT|nr:hypothetical protein [Tautonia plasticadhaerens]QDV34017.1 hypothetical protein ElP_18980 [Tautonia plasticadhaerens]
MSLPPRAPRRLLLLSGPVAGLARSAVARPGVGTAARPTLRVRFDAEVAVTLERWSAAGRSSTTYAGATIDHLLPRFAPGERCRVTVSGGSAAAPVAGFAELVAP